MNSIIFENKGDIKMIAHRGLSGIELQNTCAAFVAAAVKSYYGIETDIHLTSDGKFILVHDDNLKDIAGLDMSVEGSCFDDLRAVRLKDTDGVSERADLFLPTLEEYITICKKYSKQAILELKNLMPAEKVWEIAEKTKELGWFHRVTFISFNGENLVNLRKKYPDADAQFLTLDCKEEKVKFVLENRFGLDVCGYGITKEAVDTLHAAGLVVNVWTVDRLEDAEKLRALGVDMITTNILE